MAGGRRPSNYNPSMRTQVQNTQSPVSALWSSSIWQLPDLSTATAAATQPQAPPAGSQLAQALDAAVQAAVIRALDVATTVPRNGDDDNESTCSSTRSIAVPALDESLLIRLRNASDANAALRIRADAADARADSLERRLKQMENTFNMRQQDSLSLQADVARIQAQLNDVETRASDQLASVLEDLQNIYDREQERERAAYEGSTRAMARIDDSEKSVSVEIASICERISGLETRMAEWDDTKESEKDEFDRRIGTCVAENVGVFRGRLRKLESCLEKHRKATEEAGFLQSGTVEGVRAEVDKVRGDTAGLKKLVEGNLRAHASAESVVKEQVSVITRHVCSAMRAYTTRRLEENNNQVLAQVRNLTERSSVTAKAEEISDSAKIETKS